MRPLSQADLQAILAHLNSDDPDELLAGTSADRPVVAVRARASVGQPGRSAQATWRRARAAEWAAWTRTLPWRVAATLGIGASGGLLALAASVWFNWQLNTPSSARWSPTTIDPTRQSTSVI